MEKKTYDHLNRGRKKLLIKFKTLLRWKAVQKVGAEGIYLNIMKAKYDKPTANIILSGENWKHFLQVQEVDTKYSYKNIFTRKWWFSFSIIHAVWFHFTFNYHILQETGNRKKKC